MKIIDGNYIKLTIISQLQSMRSLKWCIKEKTIIASNIKLIFNMHHTYLSYGEHQADVEIHMMGKDDTLVV